jgi:hypothetical protein
MHSFAIMVHYNFKKLVVDLLKLFFPDLAILIFIGIGKEILSLTAIVHLAEMLTQKENELLL